jgi:hypothetical protein
MAILLTIHNSGREGCAHPGSERTLDRAPLSELTPYKSAQQQNPQEEALILLL